jgi:5'(3')-deoxyribonucleotidase
MKIGIDIDDTIAFTNEKLIEAAFNYDKENLSGKGFKDKGAYKFVDMFYWTKDNVQSFFNYIRGTNFFLTLDMIPGSLYYINKLYDEGNEIYFITFRTNKYPKVLENTKIWLNEKGYKYNKLFMRCEDKGALCKEFGIDVFIDNTYEHIESALSYGIDAILFDTVYNQDIDDVKRMNSWEEIYNYIKEVRDGENS